MDSLVRENQRTLCKKFVEPLLWAQVLFQPGDDMQRMIKRIQDTFDTMQPKFSRKIQFLNLKIRKDEGKLDWAMRLQEAADLADLESIKAQELKFLKYCQGLKTDDKLYDLLMDMEN